MSRLRTDSKIVSYAISARTEGMGMRAAGRTFGKAHSTIALWEQRFAEQLEKWSPKAPAEKEEVTVEGDEVYTRVGKNLPPQ